MAQAIQQPEQDNVVADNHDDQPERTPDDNVASAANESPSAAGESDAHSTPVDDSASVTNDAAPDASALQEALDEAIAKAADSEDKRLRLQAELDNIRKRHKRDLEHAHKYGLEKIVSELLDVRDSLEMGLDHAKTASIDAEKLKEGSELTLRMLVQIMEKFNVVQLDPQGEPFNPERHEAMATAHSDEIAPNNVMQVIQKGYLLHDRLIRPARVIVAKAADKETQTDT